MQWQPITEGQLLDEINQSYERMSLAQKRCWDMIKISPEKWKQIPYCDQGNGFWVVAIIGKTVIWFNDIEDGFNRSKYKKFGTIDEYWCSQDQLEWTVQSVIDEFQNGYGLGDKLVSSESID